MKYEETCLAAAQGIDTLDLLDHIAWTDVLRPQLDKAREALTRRLVDLTLRPTKDGEETREMIAGKLWGLEWVTKLIEEILRRGGDAKSALAAVNMHLQ